MSVLTKKRIAGELYDNKKGASLVEFAILLVPFMYILIGIMNFGYAFYAYNSMQNTAIETVRSFAHGQRTKAQAIAYANSATTRFGGGFQVTIDDSGADFIEITLTGNPNQIELVDFPYASLGAFTNQITIEHRTPVYNTNPYI
ncbi:MAG: TadE family protein [Pseudomonadota bacterium]